MKKWAIWTIAAAVWMSLCSCGLSETASEGNEEENASKAAIEFSQVGGCYAAAFDLEIIANDGGTVYYTTDGSNPLTSSTRMEYVGAVPISDKKEEANVVSAVDPNLFDTAHARYQKSTKTLVSTVEAPDADAVDKCTVIKAVSVAEDGSASDIFGQTYFIGSMSEHIEGIAESCSASGTTLAVISITMNYEDLFDPKTGIYVKGKIFEDSFAEYLESGGKTGDDCGRKLAANYSMRGKEWEREAYLDFYECDGESALCVLSQSCGIRIQGNYSRSDLQKGFRLYARETYGDKRFRYALFEEDLKDDNGEVMDSFKTFVLRNGGNCAFTAKYNDTYWQSLLTESACETQYSRPAVVYLNGEYWGLYVMQEDYSEEYFEDTHGVDSDRVVLYKGDAETYARGYKLDLGKLPEGVTDERYYFIELLDFFGGHRDLTDEADYEAFAKLVDVESCRDYFAAQVWINNKWDWPGKNWSMWKVLPQDGSENPYDDGRWRFCFYDMEFGGVSGRGDIPVNTIKEDNYRPKGLLDMGTDNPAVLCFAYLMTNEHFREDFCEKLYSLSENEFAYEHANERLENFENVYGPLFDQFYRRYPGTGSRENALSGGYASSGCIRDFLRGRAAYIDPMVDFCKSQL